MFVFSQAQADADLCTAALEVAQAHVAAMLEKLGAVVGLSNLHIYAAMRGQTLEAFQQTRNQQVTYSVAGKR